MAVEMVRIEHPEIDGTALVPSTALAHMDERWKVVDEHAGTSPAPAGTLEPADTTKTSDAAPAPARKARKRASSTQKE